MKTLAQLKRDANNGRMNLELIEWYGKTNDDIPKRLRGVRKVKKSNTVALILINADGKESELRFDSAKLIDYTDDSLIVYAPAQRDLTEEESRVLKEVQRLEKEYYKQNPYGEFYWQQKRYFTNCPCPWMSGYETVRGKRYMYNGKVMDNSIKGDIILKYKIYMTYEIN